MSYMSEKDLRGRQLIAQQLITTGFFGLVLPYKAYQYIDHWMKLSHESFVVSAVNEVLLELSKKNTRIHSGYLDTIDKRVRSIISLELKRVRHGYQSTTNRISDIRQKL